MSKATKTIRQRLANREHLAEWCATTHTLFNVIAEFYFSVIQAHERVLALSNQDALTALERLTHATHENPDPVMPLAEIAQQVPAMFRRAAINAAIGSARSFYTSLAKWRTHKVKAEVKHKLFTERPPVPPRTWNKAVPLYSGMSKGRKPSSLMLRLWNGQTWIWVKCKVNGRDLPDGWEAGSPTLVHRNNAWWVHTPLEKRFASPGRVKDQLMRADLRICAVDLNLDDHIAVCSILSADGTPLVTRFIGNGGQVNGRRKTLLGRIARNRRATGVITEGEQDNRVLWTNIHILNEQVSHRVSRRIIDFAQAHGATLLVFEHLGNLRPTKGRYSHRANQKRAHWMKGKIFQYARYKAWEAGIVTCRVSPRGTSRECARCHSPVIRYVAGQPEEGYTPGASLIFCTNPVCRQRDHADRNASIVIGQRLLARSQSTRSQEKPLARSSRKNRFAKAKGGALSQDAQSKARPSTARAGHGESAESGTAQGYSPGMAGGSRDIPRQLPLFPE